MTAAISFLKGQLLLFFSPFGLCGSMLTYMQIEFNKYMQGGGGLFSEHSQFLSISIGGCTKQESSICIQ